MLRLVNIEIRNIFLLFHKQKILQDEKSTKLPKYICEVCKHILESIVEFRDKCKSRDEQLRATIQIDCKKPIKIEEVEECLPIEELTIKDEDDMLDFPDKTEFVVEYLEDNLNEEEEEASTDEDQHKEELVVKKPLKKRDRSKKTEHPCEICKTVFSKWIELNEHKKAVHLDCPVCSKTFASYRLMMHHKVNVHAGDTHCHLCGKHITNRTRLIKHIRSFHNKERNHKCDQCGKAFFFQTKLKAHLATHSEIRSEICDFENCDKSYKTIECLKAHKKTHYPMENSASKSGVKRPYIKRDRPAKTIICQLCGKILKTNAGYEIHMRVHQDEKPFECKDCDKTFRDKGSLMIHGRRHANVRPYECDSCPKKFLTLGHLKKHKISIHDTEMRHECHICGKRTKLKTNLTLHMKIHGIGTDKNKLI